MKIDSLSKLLAHEIVDLYSAEEQIIEALPKMIEKANNQELKKALKEHLKITEQQQKRLEKVHKLLQQEDGSSEEELGETECMGMKGLIEEGEKAMQEDMEPEVLDAAIIASAQKIEHYEISGYGTACAFARELGLNEVEKILRQTLDEEYMADDLLTDLAVGGVNEEGEEEISVRRLPASRKSGSNSGSRASGNGRGTSQRSSSRSSSSSNGRSTSKRSSGARSSGRTKKSASSSGRSKSTTSKSKSSGGSRSKSKSRGR